MPTLHIPPATGLPDGFEFFFDFLPGILLDQQKKITRQSDKASIPFVFDVDAAMPDKDVLNELFPKKMDPDEAPSGFTD